MAELKTRPTDASVADFLNSIADEAKRRDCFTLVAMMQNITGAEPRMWGSSIVGFGDSHFTYASGREGDWFWIGFSPRKQNLTLYLTYGVGENDELLSRLGKHKLGKSCLYLKRLSDADPEVLERLIEAGYRKARGG